MPRLTSTDQLAVSSTKETVATFHTHHFTANPKLIKAYAAFLEVGGDFKLSVSQDDYTPTTVTVSKGKSQEELDELLAQAQGQWDKQKDDYDVVVRASEGEDDMDVENWPQYRKNGVRYFANAEGWPIPALVTEEAVKAWEAAKE